MLLVNETGVTGTISCLTLYRVNFQNTFVTDGHDYVPFVIIINDHHRSSLAILNFYTIKIRILSTILIYYFGIVPTVWYF